MCDRYYLREKMTGKSGMQYDLIESLQEAEDLFGRDALLESVEASDIDKNFCLCIADIPGLLMRHGLRPGSDFRLDWHHWDADEKWETQ